MAPDFAPLGATPGRQHLPFLPTCQVTLNGTRLRSSWSYAGQATSSLPPHMSGHSKWHNIKVRKMAVDAKRGKIYTRHARLIEIAAREKGGDPDSNPRLRTIIENARADSVPNVIIDRAIKKGTGILKDGARMEEVMYEAFGPGGTAYLIECLTENRNRTLSNVKNALHKHGGRFAEQGAVAWMFERKGFIIADAKGKNVEEIELIAIDAGTEDLSQEENILHAITPGAEWGKVRDALKNAGCIVSEAGLKFIPTQIVEISNAETSAGIASLIEALEEDEDVSEVHTNAR